MKNEPRDIRMRQKDDKNFCQRRVKMDLNKGRETEKSSRKKLSKSACNTENDMIISHSLRERAARSEKPITSSSLKNFSRK